jgi:integrase
LQCRLHDLRHSFTTVGREQGFSDYVIATLVGHAISGMTGRYGDVPDDTVKRAADNIAERIASRMAADPAPVASLSQDSPTTSD